jgi:hypothetical protein
MITTITGSIAIHCLILAAIMDRRERARAATIVALRNAAPALIAAAGERDELAALARLEAP